MLIAMTALIVVSSNIKSPLHQVPMDNDFSPLLLALFPSSKLDQMLRLLASRHKYFVRPSDVFTH